MTLDEIRKLLEGGGHEFLACHHPEVIERLLAVAEAAKDAGLANYLPAIVNPANEKMRSQATKVVRVLDALAALEAP